MALLTPRNANTPFSSSVVRMPCTMMRDYTYGYTLHCRRYRRSWDNTLCNLMVGAQMDVDPNNTEPGLDTFSAWEMRPVDAVLPFTEQLSQQETDRILALVDDVLTKDEIRLVVDSAKRQRRTRVIVSDESGDSVSAVSDGNSEDGQRSISGSNRGNSDSADEEGIQKLMPQMPVTIQRMLKTEILLDAAPNGALR
ncbi:hypothetical protein BASA83_006565 [Batrachochytrium salamandrivorans]|nr:hypothetical protein BASA83_006565 [Batrachochytrium salamandrivorans]